MADQATQAPNNPPPDVRSIFREELKPLQDTTRSLQETNSALQTRLSEVGQQLDKLETEVRAAPQMKVSERTQKGSPEDAVLARAFFNRDLEELRAMAGGVSAQGGPTVQRAFSQALIATNGTLNAEQADTFISKMLDQSGFLQLLNVEPMNGPTKEVSKMEIASRILRKKTGGVKPANADVSLDAPLILSSVEYGVSTQVYFETLEDNIMRGRATNYILDLFGTVLANDMADLVINGDAASADPFLSIDSGYLALLGADNTVHDVVGSAMAGDVRGALFPAMRDALPQRYRRLMPSFLVSHKIRDAYLDQLENRPTDLGDVVLANGWKVPTWQGFPVIGVDFMPDAAAILTPLSNLVFGVQRNITFGVDVYNAPRYADYAWTMRTDAGIMHGDTAALCVNFAFA